MQGGNYCQIFRGIGGLLHIFESFGGVDELLQVGRTHGGASAGQPLLFSSLLLLRQIDVRFQYNGGTVLVIQKKPINHTFKKRNIIGLMGFHRLKGRFKGDQGQRVFFVKPGGQ